jgi:thioredoxin-related protein
MVNLNKKKIMQTIKTNKMKKQIKRYRVQTLIVLLMLTTITNIVEAQGIKFEYNLSWEQIKAKAKVENKYIFLDAVASWCGPCKLMSKEVFPDSSLTQFFTQNFVACQIQIDVSAGDSEEIKNLYSDSRLLKKQLDIQAFPSLFFFSPNGVLVHKALGFRDAKGMLSLGKAAINEQSQYYTKLEQFRKGKRDFDFVLKLIIKAKDVGDQSIAKEIMNTYTSELSKDSLYTEKNLVMISNQSGIKDQSFKIILNHQRQVDSVLGIGSAKEMINGAIYNEYFVPIIQNGVYAQKHPDFIAKKAEMVRLYNQEGLRAYLKLTALYNYIMYTKYKGGSEFLTNWINIKLNLYKEFPDEFFSGKAIDLNNDAWFLFQKSSQKNQLAIALKWSQKATQIEPKSGNWKDTYANLLFKLGRVKEAIVTEKNALKLEPENNDIKTNLEKMERSEKTWPDNK